MSIIAVIAGPLVALLGIGAVVFVMRHKSVEKHSMYSSRRGQIEHKVRAARQRTLAPHGHEEKPAAPPAAGPPPAFPATTAAPTFTYEPAAYQPPPAAPPPAVQGTQGQEASPWDVSPAAPPPPTSQPAQPYEPPRTEPEPTYAASPPASEVWTPAPPPAAPLPPAEPVQTTTPAGAGASWSIVGEARPGTADAEPTEKDKKKKSKQAAPSSAWQLASGEAPGMEADEEIKKPSSVVAIAQYALYVVGLVMVLIGVLVMVANSHGT